MSSNGSSSAPSNCGGPTAGGRIIAIGLEKFLQLTDGSRGHGIQIQRDALIIFIPFVSFLQLPLLLQYHHHVLRLLLIQCLQAPFEAELLG